MRWSTLYAVLSGPKDNLHAKKAFSICLRNNVIYIRKEEKMIIILIILFVILASNAAKKESILNDSDLAAPHYIKLRASIEMFVFAIIVACINYFIDNKILNFIVFWIFTFVAIKVIISSIMSIYALVKIVKDAVNEDIANQEIAESKALTVGYILSNALIAVYCIYLVVLLY